ncbi:DUF554 domain-containing protein [Lacticaseibacillus sharpeae]|uniref:Integral membrane protein n=1 Tax=Lacticaseibacillus sharpeae JCM 1186 = DSM 20505 TaxID=1291052 RepID=A0A0R1ZM37_9LACO|nr:DUF554 domain-containing protein [Lacticaseibacillus sharpeae]KRM56061.1 hypothetical protein FC18_GL000847 [Lacticaseibacillus sharpeae JCM 1186 = DSM 20505]
MPTGVIVNALATLLGGIFGALGGHLFSEDFKDKINMIFGACSMGMGIYAIAPMKNMPVVIFAVIIGTAFGLLIHLGDRIDDGARLMQKGIGHIIKTKPDMPEKEFTATLVTIIVLFCASGTGIYGALTNGMTGDATILISKSILDFFTAAIFAINLGYVVALIAVPQFIILYILFLLAGVIFPLTTPTMIFDFKAAGGFLMLATGFRMIKVKMFPTADMIPAMVLVMPLSWAWTNWIAPLLK